MKRKEILGRGYIGIVCVNILLLVALVMISMRFKQSYDERLFEKNTSDIMNLNRGSATISSEIFSSMGNKLGDISAYLNENSLTKEEVVRFMYDSNQRSNFNLQLIDANKKGISIDSRNIEDCSELDYASYNNLKYIFQNVDPKNQEVLYTSEFTDAKTHMPSFARYGYISIEGEPYTILSVSNSDAFLDLIHIRSEYTKISTILMNEEGEYIINNWDFPTTNLFSYIREYNSLTLDNIREIKESMQQNEHGYYLFLNARSNTTVFAYEKIKDSDYYAISQVELNSFQEDNFDLRFGMAVAVVLVLIAVIDILWLTAVNKKLMHSNERAKIASEAKTEFLSRMSHDIRTPINVIAGMSELASMEDNPPETKEYLENIQSSSSFLLGLVNDILDMNKVESGMMELHPKAYSMKEFKKYIDAIIVPLCKEKNIQFIETMDEANYTVYVDPLRFNQVFFNLLSNAAKFTQENGTIELHGEMHRQGNGQIALEYFVKDNGIGMSEEFQKTMFTSFTQENQSSVSNVQGSGLGLAIVKKLVDLMHGKLEVESALGEGSTFTVRLVAQEASENKEIEENVSSVSLEGKEVLVCEDHPLNAKIVRKLLEIKGIKVTLAENGKIGLDLFSSSKENQYDAILMDMKMPVMNGIEATKAIRALQREDAKHIPIIALTANAYDTDVQNCIDAGMTAHLSKPIDSALLYETLQKYSKSN